MITLVNFLLLVEKIVEYEKKNIDCGKTPLDIYKICCCIKETFCLSYAIRKDNNLYLYFQEDKVLIKFKGNELRYLGSDERSQALLLSKALNKVRQGVRVESKDWIESTPGIHVKKLKSQKSLILYLNSMNINDLTIVCDSIAISELLFLIHIYDLPIIKKFSTLKNLNEKFYILSMSSKNNALIITFLRKLVEIFPSMLERVTIGTLHDVKAIEDKILNINFHIDKQGNK